MAEKLRVRYPKFGERLRRRLHNIGGDVGELKKELDVTYEMARRYYNGIAMPRAEKMERLARYLGVMKAWLEHGEGEPFGGVSIFEAEAGYREFSDDTRQVAIAYEQLSEAQRAYYRESIFRDAAIAKTMPWFQTGKPDSDSYADYEERMEKDFHARVKQLRLNF